MFTLAVTLIFTSVFKLAAGKVLSLMIEKEVVEADLQTKGEQRPSWIHWQTAAEASKSFPSGHASISFAAMTYVSMWLCGKFGLLTVHSGSVALKALLALCPYCIASFVAISRTRDYHHDFTDITAGSSSSLLLVFLTQSS